MNSENLIRQIVELSPRVRYVALYRGGELVSHQRSGVEGSSTSESDRYEELFINPALLALARQRGNLDCGGAQFVLVRYGNFFQLVVDLPNGHASVCFALSSNPLQYAQAIQDICKEGSPSPSQ